jgi:hypothetical protein
LGNLITFFMDVVFRRDREICKCRLNAVVYARLNARIVPLDAASGMRIQCSRRWMLMT